MTGKFCFSSGSQLEQPEPSLSPSSELTRVAVPSMPGARPPSYGPLYMSATVENFEYESDYALGKISTVGSKRTIDEVEKKDDDMSGPAAKKIGLFFKSLFVICLCMLCL